MIFPDIAEHIAARVRLRAGAAAASADIRATEIRNVPQLGSNAVFAHQEFAVEIDRIADARAVIDAERAALILQVQPHKVVLQQKDRVTIEKCRYTERILKQRHHVPPVEPVRAAQRQVGAAVDGALVAAHGRGKADRNRARAGY